ncbi:ficolin-1-like isoform X2 [Drosophila innubila]|nr:ficolin-1-like isoform X2 [Drosophila innubila]
MPSGIYEIQIPKSGSSKVYCDTKTWGGPWTVILRRMDGSVNFYRTWRRYREGFGDLDGEFFLGLYKIYALTSESSQELLVQLEDSQGNQTYESYGKFAIASDDEYFALNTLGEASGTAGDSLSHHHTQPFTTYDLNNGNGTNCAEKYTGGWWYGNPCHESNLCGKYGDNTFGKGVNWKTFRGFENSLKRVVMMIRPRKL